MTHPDLKIDLAGTVTRVSMTSDPMTIGRSSKCDIVIAHPSISKVHASIEQVAQGRWRITDLDSKNGLVVTGVREKRVILTGSEVVQLGEAVLKVDLKGSRSVPKLATPLKLIVAGVVILLLLEMRSPENPTPPVEGANTQGAIDGESPPVSTQGAAIEPMPEVKSPVSIEVDSSIAEESTVAKVNEDPEVVPEAHSWSQSVGFFRRLLGRPPTTGEFQNLRQVGMEEMAHAALGDGELWRARGRKYVGENRRVPVELRRLRGAPVDRSLWGEWLGREPASSNAPPLPGKGGDDSEFLAWVLAAHSWQPGDEGLALDQFRSLWVSLLDRPPTIQEETILDSIVAEGIHPGEIATRLALLLALSPHGFEREPEPGEELVWVQRCCERFLGGMIPEETIHRWADEITRGELSPLLARARWAAAAYPPGRGEAPRIAPQGIPRLQIDLFIIPEAGALVSNPRKYSRFWSRLSQAHLHLFPDGEEPRAEVSKLLDFESRGTWMEVRGVGERRVDGWLLPGLAKLAGRLEVSGALPRETAGDQQLLEDLVAADLPLPGTSESTSLFKAGGWRLVPGEWRAPLYTEGTRMLLLAGAQLNARPFASLSLRMSLSANAFSGELKEWKELMTALALLEKDSEDHSIDLWFWGNASGGHSTLRVVTGPAITRGRVFRELVPALTMRPDLKLPGEGTEPAEEEQR